MLVENRLVLKIRLRLISLPSSQKRHGNETYLSKDMVAVASHVKPLERLRVRVPMKKEVVAADVVAAIEVGVVGVDEADHLHSILSLAHLTGTISLIDLFLPMRLPMSILVLTPMDHLVDRHHNTEDLIADHHLQDDLDLISILETFLVDWVRSWVLILMVLQKVLA